MNALFDIPFPQLVQASSEYMPEFEDTQSLSEYLEEYHELISN